VSDKNKTIAAAMTWLNLNNKPFSSIKEMQAFDLVYNLLAVVNEQEAELEVHRGDSQSSRKIREYEMSLADKYRQRTSSESICR